MHAYRQPLGVIGLVRREEGIKGVVSWDDKAGKVGEELASEVEDDKEEVESHEADDGIGLRDGSALLEVVQGRVLRELEDRFHVSDVLLQNGYRPQRRSWRIPPCRAGPCSSAHDPERPPF